MIDEVPVVEKLGKSEHQVLIWETVFQTEREVIKPTRDYRNANYTAMKDRITQI